MTNIDTHTIVKHLVASGLSEEQAEIFVAKFVTKDEKELLDLVTKNDLRVAMAELKTDLIKWMIPFFLTIIALIITCLFKN